MEIQIRKARVLIDTYQNVVDAWGGQRYPLNIAPTAAALAAGMAEIASIECARRLEMR